MDNALLPGLYFLTLALMLIIGVFLSPAKLGAVGLYMRAGWREPIMFFRFRCKVHGFVVNYPMGYAEKLWCPVCMEAENSRFTQKSEVTQK